MSSKAWIILAIVIGVIGYIWYLRSLAYANLYTDPTIAPAPEVATPYSVTPQGRLADTVATRFNPNPDTLVVRTGIDPGLRLWT